MVERIRTTVRGLELPTRLRVPELGRVLPSGRSLLAGGAVLVAAAAAYLLALETSLFAVRTVDVRAGTPQVRAEVRAALADEVGRSLLHVDEAGVASRLAALPDVRSFTFDRDFPHTLRVVVRRERPVLVVRRVPGDGAFLVAASGKVLRPLPHAHLSSLPRLWVTHAVAVTVGAPLPATQAAAAAAVAAGRGMGLPGGIRTVRSTRTELTLTLGSGLEVLLGDPGDLRLKLTIARRIIGVSGGAAIGTGYLDVSVPGRPVLRTNSQVGG